MHGMVALNECIFQELAKVEFWRICGVPDIAYDMDIFSGGR